MATFSKMGGMKLEGTNKLHDTVVTTSLPINSYSVIEQIMEKAKLSVRRVTERTFVPEDKIVIGNGSAESYKEGQIFIKRPTKGTACIKGLIPVSNAAVNNLKASIMSKKIGGETPVSVTVSYTNA